MSKRKVCPKMLAGLLANPNINVSNLIGNKINQNVVTDLPKCLKEDCEMWVGEAMLEGHTKIGGFCGLKA